MRIAHCVENYEPAKGGMPEVVKQLSERMVAAGHSITVFTSAIPERKSETINGVKVISLNISGNRAEGIRGDTDAYFHMLREDDFDIITFFAAQQWTIDAVIDRLKELPARKVFVPTGFSHLRNPVYTDYFRNMKSWLHDFDMNVFLSDNYQDINFARENGVTQTILIPNGAAEEEFEAPDSFSIRRKLEIRDDQLMLLHVGTYTGVKGHREAIKIFIAADTGNAVLVLAGNKMHYLENAYRTHYSYFLLRIRAMFRKKRIVFTELERAETVAAFKEADLFFFPSNVECSPIVLFESMAAATPFLASDAGNTAEIIEWSNGGWLLPGSKDANGWIRIDIPGSTAKLEEVLSDRKRMKRSGEDGHIAWKKKFTWNRIAEQYINLYKSLLI